MSKQLVFLGAPGSGKGTQASKLVEEVGYNHVSTGDLLRNEISKGSELGRRVDDILKSGDLVNDQTVLELLKANCDVASSFYIFDGFPRTLEQAKMLTNDVLDGAETLAVFFDLDINMLVDRLTNRRTCKSCKEIFNLKTKPPKAEGKCDKCSGELYQREDDKEDVIRKRIDVYNSTISPVIDFYEEQNKLVRVNASQDPGAIFGDLKTAIK